MLFSQNPPPSVLMCTTLPYPWEQDTYLSPVVEDDPLLQVDFCTEESLCGAKIEGESESDYKEALTRALTDLESMR